MNILFLSNFYPPNVFGGYERLCFDVAVGLADKGHKITVLTSNYGEFSQENYNHCVLRKLEIFATKDDIYKPFEITDEERKIRNFNNNEIIKKVIDEKKPDILFVWNLYFYDKLIIQQIQGLKLPKAYLLTDNWLIAEVNNVYIQKFFKKIFSDTSIGDPFGFLKRFIDLLKDSFFRIRHKIKIDGLAVFPSNFMRTLYLNAGFRFSGGTNICNHGVRIDDHKNRQYFPRLNLTKGNRINILIAGRIVHIKGVHVAIKAFANLISEKDHENIFLTIVGDATDRDYFNQINELVDTLGIKDRVFFRPSVDEGELFKLFQNYDIYLFPSLYEPFSLTLILALNSGIPTIASNIGGNIELIEDGKSGLLFESNNHLDLAKKIKLLVSNGRLRKEISIIGIEKSKLFGFNQMIYKLESILIQFQNNYYIK